MYDIIDRFVDFMFFTFIALFVGITVWLSVWLFFDVQHDAECLEQGYPAASTTWDYTGYCITVDAASVIALRQTKDKEVIK